VRKCFLRHQKLVGVKAHFDLLRHQKLVGIYSLYHITKRVERTAQDVLCHETSSVILKNVECEMKIIIGSRNGLLNR